LNCTGWTLSALHRLDAAGYTVSLLLFGAACWCAWRRWQFQMWPPGAWRKFLRRCRRPLPAIFLCLAALIFYAGLFYAPTNYDALTYRLPRMLNWEAAGHWFWIPTFNSRMNYSGVGWEWIAMPLLVLTRSDRGMFLINALGFLMMPGLLFSIFRQLGVARRVAWTWMWLLPLAYGYVTQAGSIGNDLTGTVFCLLSVHFGLRSRRSGRVGDVWLALLAAALMTCVKLSNLPLALPCLVAVWPALIRLGRHWLVGLVVAGVCVVVSAMPIMVLNWRHAGSWNADPQNQYQMQVTNPAAAFFVNSFLLAEQSLVPPVLPRSKELNSRLVARLPEGLTAPFPRLQLNNFTEFPGEENAGLGLGVTLPLLLVLGGAVLGLRPAGLLKKLARGLPPVAVAAWFALIFFMIKSGSEAGPRLLLPYCPLVIVPFLLLSAHRRWLRKRGWRIFLVTTALGVLPVLVLSVARPLWPALTVTGWLARTHPQNQLLQRLAATYAGYATRNDFLAPLRSAWPEKVREIGFIAGGNDTDYSLWRPFGQRQVIYLRADQPDFLAHPDKVEWVVIKENIWPEISPVPLTTWAAENHADIVASLPLVEIISWGPEKWCVLHFKPPTGSAGLKTP
jgi:hypothetical protein